MRMWQGIITITLLGLSPSIFTCDLHYYSSGIEVSGSHLVNLTHPKFVTTAVGNKTNVVITYSRSEQNDSAVIELIGTKNIHFDKQRHVLSERSGEVAIGFTLNQFGFALVKMKVHGKQNGKEFFEVNKFFVRAAKNKENLSAIPVSKEALSKAVLKN